MNTRIAARLRCLHPALLATTLLVLILSISACTSSKVGEKEPEIQPENDTLRTCPLKQTNDLESATQPTNGMKTVVCPPAEKPSIPKPPPPPASPRPWNVDLKHGSQQATIDGTSVFLLEAAMVDKTTKQVKASKNDYANTLSPLLNARTNAIAPDRPLRVFIDPGHGGEDSGALSRDRKTLESHLNLIIAKRLAQALQNAGFQVMLSRSDNRMTQILEERTVKAFRWKADIFVSIHFNANTSPSAQGFETYILPPQGSLSTSADNPSPATQAQSNRPENGNAHNIRNMQLGFAIHRRSIRATRLADRGLRRARFVVLREARMPAVLVECGFLTSARDLKFILTAEGQEKITRGIYEGICDYAFGTLTPEAPAHPIKSHPPAKQPTKETAPRAMPPMHLLPPPITVDTKTPKWVPPKVETDPNEDPRLKRTREEAAAAAGLINAKKQTK